jgi:hypothetical protein
MKLNIYNINEKLCGYVISITFFSILLSTAIVNVGILITVFTGLIILIKNKDFIDVFFRNKINLSIVFLISVFIFSSFYSVASSDELILSLKKYLKLLYIPVCYYIFKIEWIRVKAINYFITGSTIILILSYLKFYGIVDPLSIEKLSNFFSADFGSFYQDKLLGGVTIFQHSIIHGAVLSFYFIITFLKARKNNNLLYYLLSFLSFYNVLFMNLSRTSYIIMIIFIFFIIYHFSKDNKYKQNFVIFLILIFSIIAGNKSTLLERYNNTLSDIISIKNDYYATSFGLRYIYADNGIRNMILKPIFGHGVGSYKSTIKNYFSKNNLDMHDYITQNPHNEIISVSTQTGFLGLSIFLGFIYFLIKDFCYTNIGKSVVVIIVTSCLFNSLFYDNVMGIFAVLIISYAMQKSEI